MLLLPVLAPAICARVTSLRLHASTAMRALFAVAACFADLRYLVWARGNIRTDKPYQHQVRELVDSAAVYHYPFID